ncbi:MAG: response regulator, partial [Candidatus Omnitrophica bacterium]|nr:response regulator [Candidatus Omnitrophota bacterium]
MPAKTNPKATIYLRDTDEMVIAITVQSLTKAGYQVITQEDVPADCPAPQIAILNPEMARNKAQLLRARFRHIRILIVSGYPLCPEEIYAAGGDNYLAKPFSFDALVRTVEELSQLPPPPVRDEEQVQPAAEVLPKYDLLPEGFKAVELDAEPRLREHFAQLPVEFRQRLVRREATSEVFLVKHMHARPSEAFVWPDKNDPQREFLAFRFCRALRANACAVFIPTAGEREKMAACFSLRPQGLYLASLSYNYRLDSPEVFCKEQCRAFTRNLVATVAMRKYDAKNHGPLADAEVPMLFDNEQGFHSCNSPVEAYARRFIANYFRKGYGGLINPSELFDLVDINELASALDECGALDLTNLQQEIERELSLIYGQRIDLGVYANNLRSWQRTLRVDLEELFVQVISYYEQKITEMATTASHFIKQYGIEPSKFQEKMLAIRTALHQPATIKGERPDQTRRDFLATISVALTAVGLTGCAALSKSGAPAPLTSSKWQVSEEGLAARLIHRLESPGEFLEADYLIKPSLESPGTWQRWQEFPDLSAEDASRAYFLYRQHRVLVEARLRARWPLFDSLPKKDREQQILRETALSLRNTFQLALEQRAKGSSGGYFNDGLLAGGVPEKEYKGNNRRRLAARERNYILVGWGRPLSGNNASGIPLIYVEPATALDTWGVDCFYRIMPGIDFSGAEKTEKLQVVVVRRQARDFVDRLVVPAMQGIILFKHEPYFCIIGFGAYASCCAHAAEIIRKTFADTANNTWNHQQAVAAVEETSLSYGLACALNHRRKFSPKAEQKIRDAFCQIFQKEPSAQELRAAAVDLDARIAVLSASNGQLELIKMLELIYPMYYRKPLAVHLILSALANSDEERVLAFEQAGDFRGLEGFLKKLAQLPAEKMQEELAAALNRLREKYFLMQEAKDGSMASAIPAVLHTEDAPAAEQSGFLPRRTGKKFLVSPEQIAQVRDRITIEANPNPLPVKGPEGEGASPRGTSPYEGSTPAMTEDWQEKYAAAPTWPEKLLISLWRAPKAEEEAFHTRQTTLQQWLKEHEPEAEAQLRALRAKIDKAKAFLGRRLGLYAAILLHCLFNLRWEIRTRLTNPFKRWLKETLAIPVFSQLQPVPAYAAMAGDSLGKDIIYYSVPDFETSVERDADNGIREFLQQDGLKERCVFANECPDTFSLCDYDKIMALFEQVNSSGTITFILTGGILCSCLKTVFQVAVIISLLRRRQPLQIIFVEAAVAGFDFVFIDAWKEYLNYLRTLPVNSIMIKEGIESCIHKPYPRERNNLAVRFCRTVDSFKTPVQTAHALSLEAGTTVAQRIKLAYSSAHGEDNLSIIRMAFDFDLVREPPDNPCQPDALDELIERINKANPVINKLAIQFIFKFIFPKSIKGILCFDLSETLRRIRVSPYNLDLSSIYVTEINNDGGFVIWCIGPRSDRGRCIPLSQVSGERQFICS